MCGTDFDKVCAGQSQWQKPPCKKIIEAYGVELGDISIVCIILEAVAIAGECVIKNDS